MCNRDEAEHRLLRFLEKRGCDDHFNEIIDTTDSLTCGNGFYSYLPAVTYVILRDRYGMVVSPAEVTSEGPGQARFKFIQKVRRALDISREQCVACDAAINETIASICRALSLTHPVQKEAGRLNATIPHSQRAQVREMFYYCATLVYLAAASFDHVSSSRELAHGLDISHNYLRKYERFIRQGMAGAGI